MTENLTDWVFSRYGSEQYHPGLDRINKALEPLLRKFSDTKIITIAGTNGKGETTLRLSHLLKDETHCTWTSPHIERITERFRSHEGEVSEEELKLLMESCHEQVLTSSYKLTYYEFLFYVFISWAAQRKPRYLLLEVGLGGRLDAVNALNADLVLLPSISRDHQEYLGNRYDLILKEKLGVLREDSTLISFLDLIYLRERAKDYCEKIKAHFWDLEEEISLPSFQFSARNQFLAYAAYSHLKQQEIQKNWNPLESALAGRGEILDLGAKWHLFGSHNVDGMRKLIQFLQSEIYNFRIPFDAIIIAFSQRDKADLSLMLKMMKASGLGAIKVTTFTHPKAAPKEWIESLARLEGLDFVEDIESFIQGKDNGHILVAGSYYFMGHLKSRLCRRHSPAHSRG